MDNKTIITIIITLVIYFGLSTFAGQIGRDILTPLILFVTFLHELGHALGALLTGGEVREFVINTNGSGHTTTAGGNSPIIIMGGYIGSAILGNLMFYLGTKKDTYASYVLYVVAVVMIAISIFWFTTLFTSGFLILFAIGLILIARYTVIDSYIVMFLGLASILYIIQDFNVGPTSDLKAYEEVFVFIPAQIWKYVWLTIVVALFIWNIRLIFKQKGEISEY